MGPKAALSIPEMPRRTSAASARPPRIRYGESITLVRVVSPPKPETTRSAFDEQRALWPASSGAPDATHLRLLVEMPAFKARRSAIRYLMTLAIDG